jgi:Kef-type K+ transport system membrane component KefB
MLSVGSRGLCDIHQMNPSILLPIALMLTGAKLLGELCERYLKQPAVLAEIVIGVILGKSVLGWVDGSNVILQQIAEIGAVLLLFEVGLESDIFELFRVGKQALWVATIGVILPFFAGYEVAKALGNQPIQSIFVGAALTATSVGITARVFSDISALQTIEAKIVLGAAVADDVIGLIVLAAVSGLASAQFSWAAVEKTSTLAILFLVGAILIGLRATPLLLRWARAMRTRAAISSAAIVLCLLASTLAEAVKLAPIVGAFAAGVVLTKTEEKIRFEEKIRSVADVFIPLFFVMMGARMDLSSLGPNSMTLALLLLLVAIVGKVIAGLSVPGKGLGRWVVGVGMIPRGEVGLIFASIGQSRGIIGPSLYASIVFVVIATTFITPPLLKIVTLRFEQSSLAGTLQEE